MNMSKYIRLTKTLNDKGRFIKPEELNKYITDTEKDWYTSVYFYNDKHLEYFKQNKTVSGIEDVTTDNLVFDFDSKDDLNKAKEDAKELLQRLKKYGATPKNVLIFWSGMKGFTIQLKLDKEISPKEAKHLALTQLGNGLETLDRKMYNANRLLRVPFTKHQSSGLYKIPLTYSQFSKLSIDQIKTTANSLNNVTDFEEILPISIPFEKIIEPVREIVQSDFDISKLDMINKPPYLDKARWLIANGYFIDGERSWALLCLASTYKNVGYNKEHVYRMCKAAAELQAQRTGEDRFPDEELYVNVIAQVFGPNWRNGQYTTRDPGNDLYKYAKKMGVLENSDKAPIRINDVEVGFIDFVSNIDKNTIKTGIAQLDKALPLTIGMNCGIVGGAGCHAKGAEILMYDGSIKKVEDVVVGDLLMGPDSEPRTVLELRRGVDEMVEITPHRGESFIVNENHILNLTPTHTSTKLRFSNNLNIKVKDYIDSLERGKRTVYSKFTLNKVGVDFQSKKELVIDPYILGAWLGDGHSNGFAITSMDGSILDTFIEYAEKFDLKYRIDKTLNKSVTYYFSAKEGTNKLLKNLRKMNLFENKHIPQEYLTSSRKDRLALLAGLIDTDGYLESNGCGWEYTSVSDQLANGVIFLARSLGFHASLNKRVKQCYYKGQKREGIYNIIYISGNEEIFDVPVKLERKKPKRNMDKNPNHYGFTYKKLGQGEYYGFTLNRDHLYLTSDFFVHHNSGKTSLILDILRNTSMAGVTSVFASLDMHRIRLFEKLTYKVTKGDLTRDQIYNMYKTGAGDEITDALKRDYSNVWFYDRSATTVDGIRDYVLDVENKTGEKVKLVVIDYFERIVSDMSDETAASKRVAGELQDLVNDLGVCLVVALQPNKMSLSGGPDTPILSYTAIKGSSFLYQSFRNIISIWRPFFTPTTKHFDKYMQMAILKNDLGELDTFDFRWTGKTGEITDLSDYERTELERLLDEKEANSEDDWRD